MPVRSDWELPVQSLVCVCYLCADRCRMALGCKFCLCPWNTLVMPMGAIRGRGFISSSLPAHRAAVSAVPCCFCLPGMLRVWELPAPWSIFAPCCFAVQSASASLAASPATAVVSVPLGEDQNLLKCHHFCYLTWLWTVTTPWPSAVRKRTCISSILAQTVSFQVLGTYSCFTD